MWAPKVPHPGLLGGISDAMAAFYDATVELGIADGRMIPSTSADQYAATLARWFGIDDMELDLVAPHIDNFAMRDLGFMG